MEYIIKNKWDFEFLPKDKEPKEILVAYWLFFALGAFGAHHFYLSHRKRGIYILIFIWFPIVFHKFFLVQYSKTGLLISALLIGPLFIFDLITMARQVSNYNKIYFPGYKKKSVKV